MMKAAWDVQVVGSAWAGRNSHLLGSTSKAHCKQYILALTTDPRLCPVDFVSIPTGPK